MAIRKVISRSIEDATIATADLANSAVTDALIAAGSGGAGAFQGDNASGALNGDTTAMLDGLRDYLWSIKGETNIDGLIKAYFAKNGYDFDENNDDYDYDGDDGWDEDYEDEEEYEDW